MDIFTITSLTNEKKVTITATIMICVVKNPKLFKYGLKSESAESVESAESAESTESTKYVTFAESVLASAESTF